MKLFHRLIIVIFAILTLLVFFYSYYHTAGQTIKVTDYKVPPALELRNSPDYKVPPKTLSREKLIARIVACESGGRADARNPSSTAKGIFQFLDSTFAHYGKMKWGTLEGRSSLNGSDNYELGVWVIDNYGTNDWLPSKHCWGII